MIIGVGGNLSGGKTVTCVRYAYLEGLKGYKVIGNIKLKMPEPIVTESLTSAEMIDFITKYYEDSDVLKAKFSRSVIIFDELVNIISSRKASSNLNELITNWMMMISKLQCDLLYTYQMREQIDVRLRMVTNIFYDVQRIGFKNGKRVEVDPKERTPKDVKIKILYIAVQDRGVLPPKIKGKIYDPSPYYAMYDTFEMTLLNKTVYLKGGIKDLGKMQKEQKKQTPENNLFTFSDN